MHSKEYRKQRQSRQSQTRQSQTRQRHSRQRHSRQRPSHKGGWGFFRRKQTPRKTRNPFSGFFSGFRGLFRSKPKPKVNPFAGIPEDVDPTTGRTRVVEKKSMEKFNSNKNHPVVMHLVAHPNQISSKPQSRPQSKPKSRQSMKSRPKSMNHSRRSVAI